MYRLVTDANATERPQNPRASANIFKILTFSWLLKLFKTGRKRDLNENDVYTILDEQKSSLLGGELEKRWSNELIEAKNTNRKPSLLKVLLGMFAGQILFGGFLQTTNEMVIRNCRGILIGCLLAYFNPIGYNKIDKIQACVYASALIFSMMATVVIGRYVHTEMENCGMKMRIACCSLIYKKALRLSKHSLEATTIGQVVNLTSNDVYRFDWAFKYVHYLWICPLATVLIAYLLWLEIGWSALFGVSAVFIFIPLQGWVGKNISEFRARIAYRTDERVRQMNEIMSGIQVIKMFTWEKMFEKLVHNARKMEVQELKGALFRKLILRSFRDFQTRFALLISIVVYIALGNNITTQKVFIVIAYFNIMKILSSTLPLCIESLSEMLTSVDRIQTFLLYEEQNKQTTPQSLGSKNIASYGNNINVSNNEKDTKNNIDNRAESNDSILLSNVTAKWSFDQPENCLNDINLSVAPSQLVAIIGPVGAGKSSLIQAILRELPHSDGSVHVRGVISYASQEPWLFNSSVRQNILFSSPMDEKRYSQVLNVCALETDLLQLPYGDKTIVGDKGVSLSVGQRARINLARAVYRQADIYLLDDPLSAVDPHVGKHLFEKCIVDYLKDKTRVLVTHQVQYLTNVDHIILMEKANIIAEGSFQQLRSDRLDLFKSFGLSEETRDTEMSTKKTSSPCLDSLHRASSSEQCPAQRLSVSSIEEENSNEIKKEMLPIRMSETRNSGKVSLEDYLSYISAGGSVYKLSIVSLIVVLTQILCTSEEYWISYWANLEDHVFRNANNERADNDNATLGKTSTEPKLFLWWSLSHTFCLIIYVMLNGIILLAVLTRCACHVSFFTKASMTLHNNMFTAITRAGMYFFNINSSGQILNRFTKDIGLIDESLPGLFTDVIAIGLILIATIVLVGLINIFLLIPTLCIGVIFYYVAVYILSTSRSIQRLEAVSRSPVFAHLNESLQGIVTIRAFEAEEIVSRAFDDHQDSNSSIWYLSIVSNQAFGFVFDTMCIIYLCLLIFIFLLIQNDTSGGNVGLIIIQTMSLIGNLQWGIRQCSQIENQMTSVERILEYTNLPQESILDSSTKKPPKEWPNKGNIVFQKLCLRYSPNSQYILKDVNITIHSMEKVGIVGRTGAGKSSLINALFRLALNEGNIIIDEIDIHKVGLKDLRSKLSIIPQEPVLFSGTMRKNLDPFDEYPDHILWNALDEVQLKEVVENSPGGLNSKMSEGGANFSIGQKQLVCLARAIVRRNKILILDEATANIDLKFDTLIQNTIRNKFRSCTILIIAHRLNTIIDLDKVIVVDEGRVVEFDHPHNLLKNKKGYFYKMVDQTGKHVTESLHVIAAESYRTLSTTTDFPIIDVDPKTSKNK